MCEKSWLDYISYLGGYLGVVVAVYTLYKNFVEKAKVEIVSGDRMGIVLAPGGARRIHLRGVLVNRATAKMGTLQHLEAKITSPDATVREYSWNELFEFVGTNVESIGKPVPITVPGKDSRPLLTQLELVDPTPATWTAGRHKVQVLGWVNRENRKEHPNAKCVFHITISNELALALRLGQPEYKYEDVEIEEWGWG